MSHNTKQDKTQPRDSSDTAKGDAATPSQADKQPASSARPGPARKEIGGRDGPDPARYGDWEKQGRCIDF